MDFQKNIFVLNNQEHSVICWLVWSSVVVFELVSVLLFLCVFFFYCSDFTCSYAPLDTCSGNGIHSPFWSMECKGGTWCYPQISCYPGTTTGKWHFSSTSCNWGWWQSLPFSKSRIPTASNQLMSSGRKSDPTFWHVCVQRTKWLFLVRHCFDTFVTYDYIDMSVVC